MSARRMRGGREAGLVALFWFGFILGLRTWRSWTEREVDIKSRAHIHSALETSPAIRAFTNDLDESKKWLVKKEDAVDRFRNDYLDRAGKLLDAERNLAAAETSVMLKTGEMNDLRGVLAEKNDLASELRRKLAAARQSGQIQHDRLHRPGARGFD